MRRLTLDDHGRTHLARLVVGCDGRRSTLARLVGAPDNLRRLVDPATPPV